VAADGGQRLRIGNPRYLPGPSEARQAVEWKSARERQRLAGAQRLRRGHIVTRAEIEEHIYKGAVEPASN
jgi:hypothetical protein